VARGFLQFLAAALLSAALLGCNRKEPPPPPRPPPPLSEQGLAFSSWKSATPDLHDRLLLAHAIAKGKTEALVMVATQMGGVPAAAKAIAQLGGHIESRHEPLGYLTARLPLERWSEVAALPEVLMAHLDGAGGSYSRDRDLVRYPARIPVHDPLSATDDTDTLLSAPRSAGDAMSGQESRSRLSEDIESLLRAAVDPNVPVIAHTLRGSRFPEGGQDLFALMSNRVVEFYGKPMFAPAGEDALVDTISGAASGRRVLAVGWQSVQSSRGPAADGGAKPDLLAPASTQTNEAALQAASGLLSTARDTNLPSDARYISWALRMSAKRLDGHRAHEQGFGVMDVDAAKELLTQAKARRFEVPDILVRAPVKTFLARFLPEPGIGQGLYEREGWLVKRSDKRTITLRRQNGPSTPLTYALEWRGNDGTFKSLEQEVILPFDEPVDVEIEITPAEVGIHSAHLYLVDKITGLPVHAVMTTIVASEQFTAANGYTIRHGDTLTSKRSRSYFLEVPPNVASLRVDVGVKAGQVEALLGMGGPADTGFNLPRSNRPVSPGKPAVVIVPYPAPGVYELTLLSGSANAQFDVSASIHYIDSQLDEAPPKNNSTTLWMNNIYAPLQRSSVLASVGARRMLNDVGGPTGMRAYNIRVPQNGMFRVAVSPPDGRARLGLYLYECADGTCKFWGSDVFTKTTEKFLIVPGARAGLWRIVIDAVAPGTAFNYSEIITSHSFGSGTVEGVDEPRRIGARWNQKVSFSVREPVPFGYEPVGIMDVIDEGSEEQEDAAPYSDWMASGNARNRPLRPLRLTTQVIPLQ
jgi:hypothetical protein